LIAYVVANEIAKNPPALPSFSLPKTNAEPKVEGKEKTIDIAPALPNDTVIYRWPKLGTLDVTYTPSARDMENPKVGLSFSTIPKPGSAMTTIGALNSTGVVYAVHDGTTHVSVYPIGGTMNDWHNAGPSSIWSQAVQSVCVKWG